MGVVRAATRRTPGAGMRRSGQRAAAPAHSAPGSPRGGAYGVTPRPAPPSPTARRGPTSRPPPCPRSPAAGARILTPISAAPRGPHLLFVPLEGLEPAAARLAAPRAPPSRVPLLDAEEQPATCASLGLRARSRAAQARARPAPSRPRRAPAGSAPFPPWASGPRRVQRAARRPSAVARASPRCRCCPLAEAWEDAGEPLARL